MSSTYINGMDVSFLDEIEQGGGVFSYGYGPRAGEAADLLDILKDSGVNAIRLRIWNNPPGGFCNLERTLVMAARIKAAGLQFLLDFHYSDKWADPANQWKPQDWEGLDFPQLRTAVYEYTLEVLEALRYQGTLPDMVQIGNEITPGFLWEDGRVDGSSDTPAQWAQFTDLVKAGIAGAKEIAPELPVMIHIDRGGDNAASRRFFDRFAEHGVSFDVIGLSFYPWWHGTLADLEQNLDDLARRYDKDIIVVETAYPWTLEGPDGFPLIVKEAEQLHEGYPGTVEGQAAYLRDLRNLIMRTPQGRGLGCYYWEPAWIPSQQSWSVGHENNWSNLTLFDYTGRQLASLND